MKLDPPASDEEWRDVVGWEGFYQVSDYGRVRSLDRIVEMRNGRSRTMRGRVLCAAPEPGSGRMRVGLCGLGPRRGYMKLVHRLVAEAFLGPGAVGLEVCHNDGDASNNRLSNLRWDTHVNNEADKRLHGTNDRSNRTHCPRGHALEPWNIPKYARERGKRECLACRLASANMSAKNPDLALRFQEESDRKYRRLMEKHEARCA